MCGKDTGLLEPPLGVVLQDSSPITRWTLSGGGWRQNKMLKNKMATCEFETCLGYESLSQKAQKTVAGGGKVGDWKEEERTGLFPFLSHSSEQESRGILAPRSRV